MATSMTDFSPREIVSELDRFIVGQHDAKRAVAIALRNRWRRKPLPDDLRDEVTPKNILMIGPTGVGKTEIARRLAKLAQAPFLKVEATKFTEVGYVGRDVEQIIRDLVEAAIAMVREEMRERVNARADDAAEERILDALAGPGAREPTRESFRRKLRAGELDDKEIELEVADTSPVPDDGHPRPARHGHGGDQPRRHVRQGVRRPHAPPPADRRRAYEPLIAEEGDKLLDQEAVTREALERGREERHRLHRRDRQGCARAETRGADVSREGVQRDLLPLIEGTTVSTKHGPVKTDHVLFIASGAFHVAKPSDLLPELQGRLPIRVELKALTEDDFAAS